MTIVARTAVAGAVGAWAGVGGWWLLPPLTAMVVWHRRLLGRVELAILLVGFGLGSVAGWLDAIPPDPLPAGDVTIEGGVELVLGGRWGWSGLVASPSGSVLVTSAVDPTADHLRVTGESDGRSRRVGGRWVVATVDAETVETADPRSAHDVAAAALRARIVDTVRPASSEARGLLAGFLIGDTSGVGPVLQQEMRRAGLSHLVAVSGANVALFLAGLFVVTAPLSITPVGRLLVVVNGLLVFGALTRWEPSVVRASAMAGVVGLGRFLGLPLEPVTALALVAGGGVLVEPALARSVGFQLSVLATLGLMVGARRWPGSGSVGSLVKATVAAQLAVAPLLLAAFGSVPLLSPIANVVAIPLVTAATSVAGVGAAFGIDWLMGLAETLAGAVIVVARVASPWPQLGVPGFGLVVLAGLGWWRLRAARRPITLVAAAVLCVLVLPSGASPETGAVFLDVGQGDAAVVRMSGFTMLVDGGPDPARLAEGLARHRIDRIDLAVVTHVHEDHASGVAGIIGRVPIGVIWVAFDPHSTTSAEEVIGRARDAGIPVRTPQPGETIRVAGDTVEVLGPRRRYAGANDQSIVLAATLEDVKLLLPGDVESFAQAELAVSGVDVLKVPHHGAATSDPRWLSSHAGRVAVIAVGENSFGHPAPWVVDTLRQAGSEVYRTDVHGDVIVEIDGGVPIVSASHQD